MHFKILKNFCTRYFFKAALKLNLLRLKAAWWKKRGGSVKEKNQALLEAITAGEFSQVKGLLLQGAHPVTIKVDGNATALHLAAGYKDEEVAIKMVTDLIMFGARGEYKVSYCLNHPLHLAIIEGRLKLLTRLLLLGTPVTTINFLGQLPLQMAVMEDRPDMVRLLLENGALPDLTLWKSGSREGAVPYVLHGAVREGRYECVKELLRSGATVNIKEFAGQYAPHHYVVFSEVAGREMLELLIEWGADLESGVQGVTFKQLALNLGRLDLVS